MTTQHFFHLDHRGIDFEIAGVMGTKLFHPNQHGITPVFTTTACWHGYTCRYAICDDQLTLELLAIGLQGEQYESGKRGDGPLLFGRTPVWEEERGCFYYEDLHASVPFTGGMLLAMNLIWNYLGDVGGFRRAYEYESVMELRFEEGKYLSDRDCSSTVRKIRQLIGWSAPPIECDPESLRAEMRGWFDEKFNQRLDAY